MLTRVWRCGWVDGKGTVINNSASWFAWDANRMSWCLLLLMLSFSRRLCRHYRCRYCSNLCVYCRAQYVLLASCAQRTRPDFGESLWFLLGADVRRFLCGRLSSLGDRPRERRDDPTPPGAGTVVAYVSGVFGSAGGRLYSERTGVSLVIPEGAIPEGVQQEVYFQICQDEAMQPPLDRYKGLYQLAFDLCTSSHLQFCYVQHTYICCWRCTAS